MISALAWFLYPVGLLALATGVGLLLERAVRVRLPTGLLAPAGAAVAIVLTLPAYVLGSTAAPVALGLLALAVAGAALGRGRTWEPQWWVPLAAGAAAYALHLAPVVLSGHWTWAGYNFVNDTSVNLVMVDHVMRFGDAPVTPGASTTANLIAGTLNAGYPLGVHALYSSASWLMPLPLASVYQPFIAMLAALTAMALTELARRARVPGLPAAVAAVLATMANLAYHYALHGAFKEIAIVMVLATAAALARVALDEGLALGAVAATALTLAAAIALLSAAAAAYVLAVAGVMALAVLLEPSRPRLARVALAVLVGAAVIVVVTSPYLRDAVRFGRGAGEVYSSSSVLGGQNSTSVLGHLLRPLPVYQGLGTWLAGDYRVPLSGAPKGLTALVLTLTGLLALGAVAVETVRRRWVATLAAVPAFAVYLAAAPRLSPYAEAKLLVAAAPLLVFAAALGAWWLGRRVRIVGAVAGLALTGGIALSGALAYHDVRLAPTARMEALADAADHAGGGTWLSTEWEEFAKYFGRDIRINVASESYSPRPAELRVPGPIFGRSLDLDELTLPYVEAWDGLMLRRGPSRSRPPANFALVYRNDFYELWRKRPGPAGRGSPAAGRWRRPRRPPTLRRRATAGPRRQAGRSARGRARRPAARARPRPPGEPAGGLEPHGAARDRRPRAPRRGPGDGARAGRPLPRVGADHDGPRARGACRRAARRRGRGHQLTRAVAAGRDGRAGRRPPPARAPARWRRSHAGRRLRGGDRPRRARARRAGAPRRDRALARSLAVRPAVGLDRARASMSATPVTVAVPVRDGGPRLGELLEAVRAQRVDRPVELLVADSGSTDGSAELARRHGATVFPVARFSHGGTRNELMERASGSHVAFLTQDAVPAGEGWLAALLAGFALADDVALVYGPYRPQPGAPVAVARELQEFFASLAPDGRPRVDRDRDPRGPSAATFFTDANGCVSRAAWERVPFREVPYAEDQALALDVLRAGLAKAFVPAAAAVHSHEYAPAAQFRRSFDEWRGLREVHGWVEPAAPWQTLLTVQSRVRGDLRSLSGRGLPPRVVAREGLRSLRHWSVRAAGAAAGSRADRIPPAVRRRLSLEGRASFEPSHEP